MNDLWNKVLLETHAGSYEVHGLSHWRRVERNGLYLAKVMDGANSLIAQRFALFHDCVRINEGIDLGHGARATRYIRSIRIYLPDMSDIDVDKLCFACSNHTDTLHTDDPVIAVCWDADRLDIGRTGKVPAEEFMNTTAGKEIARDGRFDLLEE